MSFIRPAILLTPISLLLASLIATPIAFAKDEQILHGQVNEQGYSLPPTDNFGGANGPSLSPSDIERAGDPFGSASPGVEDQALDAPAQAFALPNKPKPPKKKFGLNAEKEGGTTLPGGIDASAQPAFQPQQPTAGALPTTAPESPSAGMPNPNDPDSTPEMQLAWDAWHHRVAEAIFVKFNYFAHIAFHFSPPMGMQVSYEVTKDGQVQNVQILQKSPNILFDTLVVQCIKSVDGDKQLLQFPDGSRRFMVEQTAPFTWNYGPGGFRYTTGDKETIPGR